MSLSNTQKTWRGTPDQWDVAGLEVFLRQPELNEPMYCVVDVSGANTGVAELSLGANGFAHFYTPQLTGSPLDGGSGGCAPWNGPTTIGNINSLRFIFDTDGDDLNPDSTISISINGGSAEPLIVGRSSAIEDQTQYEYIFELTTPISVSQIESIDLILGGGDTDEWDVQAVEVYGVAALSSWIYTPIACRQDLSHLGFVLFSGSPTDVELAPGGCVFDSR